MAQPYSTNMKVVIRYVFFYLTAAFFFILYNYLLDLAFYKIDYGQIKGVANPLGYLGYFVTIYSPLFLPFLVLYNYAVNEIFTTQKQRLLRYGIALLLGSIIGSIVGRGGISFYIGYYRTLKTIILFVLLMLSLEFTRDIAHFRRKIILTLIV